MGKRSREAQDRINAGKRAAREYSPKKLAGILRRDKRSYVLSVKTACSVCGESHPAALDFHHRDPAQKDYNVGTMMSKTWSLQRLQEEIEKCDVLCSNCHRKLHWGKREER